MKNLQLLKKTLLFGFFFITGWPAMAQSTSVKPIRIDLWQNGLPNSNGREVQGYDDAERNYKPCIAVYLPEKTKMPTKAVVVCPGGGYGVLCDDYEGFEWVDFFLTQEVAAVILKYRLPYGHPKVPQSDVYETIRLIREHAEEWNVDPHAIGVMGFSAGGHLASTVATHARADVLPDFQILMYPVISSDAKLAHAGSFENLLGKRASKEQLEYYSNDLQVKDNTPRAFIALSDDDSLVNPLNSTYYYHALKKHRIPAALHIYSEGEHGWGMHEHFRYHLQMLSDLGAWLRSF